MCITFLYPFLNPKVQIFQIFCFQSLHLEIGGLKKEKEKSPLLTWHFASLELRLHSMIFEWDDSLSVPLYLVFIWKLPHVENNHINDSHEKVTLQAVFMTFTGL